MVSLDLNETDILRKKLNNLETFEFTSKFSLWICFCTVFIPSIFIIMGLLMPSAFFIMFIGIAISALSGLYFLVDMQQKLIITPMEIKYKGGWSARTIIWKDIHSIEYYIQTVHQDGAQISKEHKCRIIPKSGSTIKKSMDYWRTPGRMKTDVHLKTIFSFYYHLNRQLEKENQTPQSLIQSLRQSQSSQQTPSQSTSQSTSQSAPRSLRAFTLGNTQSASQSNFRTTLKFCPNCGINISDNSQKFCKECGVEFNE